MGFLFEHTVLREAEKLLEYFWKVVYHLSFGLSVDFGCGVMRSLLVLLARSRHDCVKNSKKTNMLLYIRSSLCRFVAVCIFNAVKTYLLSWVSSVS